MLYAIKREESKIKKKKKKRLRTASKAEEGTAAMASERIGWQRCLIISLRDNGEKNEREVMER